MLTGSSKATEYTFHRYVVVAVKIRNIVSVSHVERPDDVVLEHVSPDVVAQFGRQAQQRGDLRITIGAIVDISTWCKITQNRLTLRRSVRLQ